MAVSKFPRSMQTIEDAILEILTEEKPMRVEFNKLDAALFAIEGFISRLVSHGDNRQHAEYYLTMIGGLRATVSQEKLESKFPEKMDSKLADMEDRLRKVKPRASDQGKMSSKQRQAISQKMKAYWKKRRRDEKRVGR